MSDRTATSIIDEILAERPKLHAGETEVKRDFTSSESLLPAADVQAYIDGKPDCYGIDKDLAGFIRDSVNSASKSLEVGAGISTLVFAAQGAQHICVTPSQHEVDLIRSYAAQKGIRMERVTFAVEVSDKYLPTTDMQGLNFVFIDGKHAFPWPFVDWFYTADRLLKGGIMIVDDIDMISGRILVDFMKSDPRWQYVADFGGKTAAFRKLADSVHDVAWHMQPFIMNDLKRQSTFLARVVRKLRRIF